MVTELGNSRSAIQKHILRLVKEAELVERIGPDKGGEWRVVK